MKFEMAAKTQTGMIPAMDPQDLTIRSYTGGMAQTNAYLIKRGSQCLLIDAPLGVSQWLENLGEQPSDILLTHQHYDHVEDAAKLSAKGARLHAHSPHAQTLTLELLLQQSGAPINIQPYTIDNLLEGKTELDLADLHFSIEHIPGHAPDGLVFIVENHAFAGDTLFAGSIGRADLPGGNMDLLLTGIKEKLFTLPPSTRVFPGHGPETTIGTEQKSNPFLA